KEIKVLHMIHGYRDRGHLFTETNPVRERRKYFPGKELETFGLSEDDMDTVFNAGVEIGLGPAKLRDIRQFIEETYCRSIGAEFRYIRHPEKIKFLQDRMEAERNTPNFSIETKKRILKKLNEAVIFESCLGTKFLGQKRVISRHRGICYWYGSPWTFERVVEYHGQTIQNHIFRI